MSRIRELSFRTMKPAIPLFVAAVLGACATAPAPTGEVRRVTYACEHGPGVTIDYVRDDFARIPRGGDPPITLRPRQDASGVWYESITYSVRPMGNGMTFTAGRDAPKTCTETATELL